MAKMYYTFQEALEKLNCTEDELRAYVRNGQLREFRDAGKVHYRVDDVESLTKGGGQTSSLDDSGPLELAADDSQEMAAVPSPSQEEASPEGDQVQEGLTESGSLGDVISLEGTDVPVGKPAPDTDSGTGTQAIQSGTGSDLNLESSGTGELQLEDSGSAPPPKRESGEDVLNLDEVDKDAMGELKKDDTVITNIGISVFDEDDLEISADPMAKTVMSSEDEGLGLDGSTAGSGLLDLTRESDDTSLGAELLEGIDMGDTGETVTQTVAEEEGEQAEAGAEAGELTEAAMGPAPALGLGPTVTMATVPAASPAFTGLLVVAAASLALLMAATVAMVMGAWPAYLDTLADTFWVFLAAVVVTGGIGAGVGYLVGRPSSPKAPKAKKAKKSKKGKDQAGAAAEPGVGDDLTGG